MPDGLTVLCVPAFAGQLLLTLYVFFHPERSFSFRMFAFWLICALPFLAVAWRDADFTLALGECALGAAVLFLIERGHQKQR